MEPKDTKPKSAPVIMPDRIGLAEHKRQDWVADVPVGIRVEDLLAPEYWAHKSIEFKPYDTIEARADDGSYIDYLRVLYADRSYANVILEHVVKIDENSV